MISNSGTTSLGLYDLKRQIDAFGGVDYFRPNLAGGYLLNARVMLANGDIVKSTVDRNVNDPNVDMTGWVKTNTASQVITTSGETQQEVNDAQDKRNDDEINARDWGILPANAPEVNSANWFALNNAFPDRDALNIFVPIGTYSFSSGFFITRPHNIRGVGAGEKSKTIFNFTESTAVGNTDFKGNIFILHPESASGAFAVSLPVGQVGTNGTGAKVDCIKTLNGSEHGIIKNAPSYLNYVCTDSPAKHGILTVADTLNSGGTAVDSSYTAHGGIAGIANQGSNRECTSINHGWGGIVEIGNDANAVANTSCNAAYGGKFGFYDCSLLGGINIGGQAHENTIGDYVQQGSQYDDSGMPQLPSRAVYVGTYAENIRPQGYSINERSIVLGATGVQPYGASQARNALLSSVVGMYTYQAMSVCDDINDVQQGFGGDFVNMKPKELRMGVEGSNSHVKLSADGYTDRVKLMVDTFDTMMFFLSNINNTLQKNRPYFPNGLTMGEFHYQSVASAIPTTGVWDKGNIIWNSNPTTGSTIGWVCVTSGTPGIWKTFGSIS